MMVKAFRVLMWHLTRVFIFSSGNTMTNLPTPIYLPWTPWQPLQQPMCTKRRLCTTMKLSVLSTTKAQWQVFNLARVVFQASAVTQPQEFQVLCPPVILKNFLKASLIIIKLVNNSCDDQDIFAAAEHDTVVVLSHLLITNFCLLAPLSELLSRSITQPSEKPPFCESRSHFHRSLLSPIRFSWPSISQLFCFMNGFGCYGVVKGFVYFYSVLIKILFLIMINNLVLSKKWTLLFVEMINIKIQIC